MPTRVTTDKGSSINDMLTNVESFNAVVIIGFISDHFGQVIDIHY